MGEMPARASAASSGVADLAASNATSGSRWICSSVLSLCSEPFAVEEAFAGLATSVAAARSRLYSGSACWSEGSGASFACLSHCCNLFVNGEARATLRRYRKTSASTAGDGDSGGVVGGEGGEGGGGGVGGGVGGGGDGEK